MGNAIHPLNNQVQSNNMKLPRLKFWTAKVNPSSNYWVIEYKFLDSKETVVLRQWESETKIGLEGYTLEVKY